MKTLSSGYWKVSASSRTERTMAFRCSTEVALSRREVGFLVRQKRVKNGVSAAVAFQQKRVCSISAVSSSAQTDVDSEEIHKISSDEPKTVRVRIKLLKECTFGEQFLVVGDDPILGSWDPFEGVPLDWSEGHVWTAEMDIPVGKVIKYKFIHRGNDGAILWQPGSDRVLQTWETEKIISVSEDWDDPDLQKIVEEEFVEALILNEEALIEEGDNAVDNLENVSSEELEERDLSSSDKGSVIVSEEGEETSDLSSLKDEVLDEGVPLLVPGLVPASMDENEDDEVKNNVVENTITESDEVEESAESEVKNNIVENTITESDAVEESAESEVKNNIVENTITESDEVEESVESEVKNNIVENTITESDEVEKSAESEVKNNIVENTITESDEVEESAESENDEETTAELNDVCVPSAPLRSTETGEMMVDEKKRYGKEETECNVMGSDVQWGRRTLQKFLANLGFI